MKKLKLRLLKSVAMIGIAMGLSVTLVVTTPEVAQAWALGPAVAGPVLLGAATTAAPAGAVSAGGAVATGVTVSGLAAAAVPVLVVAAAAVGAYFLYQYADSQIDFPWEDNPYSKGNAQGEARSSQATKDLVYENIGATRNRAGSFDGDKQLLVQIAHTPKPGTARTIRPVVVVQRTCRSDTNYDPAAYTRSRLTVDVGTISTTTTTTAVQRVATYIGCSGGQLMQATVMPPTWDDVKANPYPNQNLAPEFSFQWTSPYYNAAASTKEYETTVTCKGTDGTITKITEKAPVADGKVPVPSCAARGLGTATQTVSNFLDGGVITGPPLLDITEGDTKFTECDPAAGGQICKTEIYIDGQPCVIGAPACESWAALSVKNPSRVTCRYGGKLVDLSACFILEGAYLYGGSPMTEANIDGNPNTWTPRRTSPGWVPNIVGPEGVPVPDTEHSDDPEYDRNPETDPDPDITTAPRPAPGTPEPAPSPSSSPGTDTGSEPGTDPGTSTGGLPSTGRNPATDPSPKGDNCLSSMWSWNPVDWVMTPVKCALSWAFVPNTSTTEATINGLRADVGAKGIDPLLDAFAVELPGEGGCMGPLVDFRVRDFHLPLYPFAACDGVMSTIAGGTKAFLSLGLVYFGGLSVIRALGAGFGFNFSMGRGGNPE